MCPPICRELNLQTKSPDCESNAMTKRLKHTPARSQRCPVHHVTLLVGRTVHSTQYR